MRFLYAYPFYKTSNTNTLILQQHLTVFVCNIIKVNLNVYYSIYILYMQLAVNMDIQ